MFIPLLFIAVLAIAGHRAGDGAMGCGASKAKDPQPAPGAPDADGTSQAEAKRIIGSGNHAIYIYIYIHYVCIEILNVTYSTRKYILQNFYRIKLSYIIKWIWAQIYDILTKIIRISDR